MEAFLHYAARRRRSPATMPEFHRGRPPRNKGLRYPPDPPTVEEIVTVTRAGGPTKTGIRMRALIVLLWRAGLRISEPLALGESDLDPHRGAILIPQGKGGKRRDVAWIARDGSNSHRGLRSEPSSPRARCSASSTAPPAADPGPPHRPGRNSAQ